MGSIVVNAVMLAVLVTLWPFVIRWAYRVQPDPLDRRQVARQRNSRIYAFVIPGLALAVIVRMVLETSRLH